MPVRDLSRDEVPPAIERLDLLILGGGGILFDAEAIYLREVPLAQERGVPVMIYAMSAGPLKDPPAQNGGANVLTQAAAVTVRERAARGVLEEIGVREIEVTADPALVLEPEPLPATRSKRRTPTTGAWSACRYVSRDRPRPTSTRASITRARQCRRLHGRPPRRRHRVHPDGARVLDPQHATRSSRRWPMPAGHGPQGRLHLRADALAGGHFDFAVGMRLHFLIFAALRVPFVALPYAKGRGLPPGAGDAHAPDAARERRPAHRPHRPLLGPAAQPPGAAREDGAGDPGTGAAHHRIACGS